MELRERKDETIETETLMNLRYKELIIWVKQELELCYAYPSPIKLMRSNGFGILLILVEKIKRDIAQTWEDLQRTTVRIEIMNE